MKEILKQLREKRGLSQSALADYLGISRIMYMKYEAGTVDPSVKTVKALAKLYGVSCDVILNEDEPVELSKIKDHATVASDPVVSYGHVYEQNNLSDILQKLPFLLYSEKVKLMIQLAQSMSDDVDARRLAQRKEEIINGKSRIRNSKVNPLEVERINSIYSKISKEEQLRYVQAGSSMVREALKNDTW